MYIPLHDAVAAVAPILGIAIVHAHDRNSWVIQYDGSETPEQRAAAEAVLLAYDFNQVAPEPPPAPQPAPVQPPVVASPPPAPSGPTMPEILRELELINEAKDYDLTDDPAGFPLLVAKAAADGTTLAVAAAAVISNLADIKRTV